MEKDIITCDQFSKITRERSVKNLEQQGISKLDLKRQNRMQILKLLKQQGPTSRIDIAAVLQLTRAAVTIITNEMIEQGIVCEVGEQKNPTKKASRGRKKILVDINHNYKFVLGVMVDDEQVSVGLSTLNGSVLDKRNLLIEQTIEYEKVFDFIVTSVSEIMSYNCLDNRAILGMGVAIMPAVAAKLHVGVNEDGLLDFSNFEEHLKEYIDTPIVCTDSTTALAMASLDFSKVKTSRPQNIALVHCGDHSVNNVIFLGNEPIHRSGGLNNHINNMLLRGHPLRDLVTLQAVFRRVSAVYSKEHTPTLFQLTNGDAQNITVDSLVDCYKAGDSGIVSVLNEACDDFLYLLNAIDCIVRPDRIFVYSCDSPFTFLMDLLMKRSIKYLGAERAACLTPGTIAMKQRFLGGCSIAIRNLFFTKGGYR